jgi:hypothetical protein
MDQKNSKTLKYKSLSTGQPCNAAQYCAELVCLRKRERENKGSLEFKFWNKSQKEQYQTNIRVANILIKKYSEKSLVRYLNSPSGKNIYSLGFLHKTKKFVLSLNFVDEGVAKCFEMLKSQDDKIKVKKEEPKQELVFKPKKTKVKNKSLFSKLRNIDGKDGKKR